MFSLLATKIRIPSTHGTTPPPERLLRRITSETPPLTLLSAPPGYGKTTLLATWAAHQPHAAWCTIDASDNDPHQFGQSLISALHPFLPDPTHDSTDLLPLLNTLHLPSPTALILDNYHHIRNDDIHTTISFLIEHLPPNLRVLIATHLLPPLPLPRWRARGLITELTPKDLALTLEELQALCEDPHTLHQLTEGWPAGVQIALAKNTPLNQLTGAHPNFAQYFADEVLPMLAPTAQEALRRLSIPDTLTLPLCRTLTTDLPDFSLETTLNTTPFLNETETTPPSYRIHPLFRAYLLAQLPPDQASELHRRAWHHLQQQHPEQALPHALSAQDLEDAARLLTQVAPHLLKTGHWPQLRRWLDQLPEALIKAHPRLWITRIWLILETYQQDTIQPYLERFDHLLSTNPPNALQSELHAIRSIIAAMRNQPESALEAARQAESAWADGDPTSGTYVAFALGAAFKMSSEPIQAEHWFRETLALAEASQNAYLAFSAHENLSDMLYQQARLPEAHLHALRAIKFATVEGIEAPFTGWIRCVLGLIAFSWNELDTAQTEAERCIELCKQWNNAVIHVRGLLLLAQIHQIRGDYTQAIHHLEEADTLSRQTGEIRFIQPVIRQRVLLALAQRNLDAARHWWATLKALPPDENTPPNYPQTLIVAHLHLAEGQPRHALDILNTAVETFKNSPLRLYDLERHILTALACRALGKPDDAAQALTHALRLAAPGKIQQPFLQFQSGAPMRELLRRLAPHSPHAPFIGTLLTAFGERAAEASGDLTLTHRETQILRLLAAGFSNRDMAEELVIAESTLKRHIANLYLKMGVHSRTQALARAQEFHLF